MAATRRPERRKGPWGANDYIAVGMLTVLGFVLLAALGGDRTVVLGIAYIGLGVASVLLLIGSVAKGVEVGVRATREDDVHATHED
jgi:uncharacterized membrane protein YuzA (DUF378 family)